MKAQHLCTDIISSLPQPIIETILCLLPIHDAARTSILSKEWRYHWTTIPKLVFDQFMFEPEPREERLDMTTRHKIFHTINQVLLMRQGPIHEFTLSMNADDTCVEIDQILIHLSRKHTVKKLSLDLSSDYMLPLSVFSLHQLMDLDLPSCGLDHQPTFNGFSNLTRIYMYGVKTSVKTLVHLTSQSPLLKSFSMMMSEGYLIGVLDSTIFDLFRCSPVIEQLNIFIENILFLAIDVFPKKLPTSLLCLEYLSIYDMMFTDKYGLRFIGILLRSAPNLEKLKLLIYHLNYVIEPVTTMKDYSDIWLEHLNELVIEDYSKLKFGLNFVKFIMAKSPVLTRVKIVHHHEVAMDEKMKVLRILLCSPRASPVVLISIEEMDLR